jgi:hypothetical protein
VAYNVAKNTCLQNRFGETQFFHRHSEGTLMPVPGNPSATRYNDPDPRTADNPMDAVVQTWMTWIPRRIMGTATDSGDVKATRAWIFRFIGQVPAIDDNGNQINLQDEDFGIDPQNRRFRIENPMLSPDGCWWTFEGVRMR